ncbi:zinc ribbon domain-containing protein [Brevibacillus brevis]|uniref:Zinc ribbon domain-containing protein n=1 Tax=Brevibacillus brevis TaxID=1393 RepID=A0ABY9T0C6_BREBE|nr:zinc ribbon domain-containing protein [Brevibacillus brevis]WNC12974.1 zinc ribbon domain-containing protein [Brevibacillus brevis]
MPRYEYGCEECGPFIQWLKMSEVTDMAVCPECGQTSRRMYSACGLILTPQALRQRIERGAEPKIVRKERHAHEGGACQHQGPAHGGGQHSHRHSPKRPWMVGH